MKVSWHARTWWMCWSTRTLCGLAQLGELLGEVVSYQSNRLYAFGRARFLTYASSLHEPAEPPPEASTEPDS